MKVMWMWSASPNISLHGTHPSLSVGNNKMSSRWDEENDMGTVSLCEVTSHYVRRGSICFPTSVVTVDRWPWKGQPNLWTVTLDRRGEHCIVHSECVGPHEWNGKEDIVFALSVTNAMVERSPGDSRSTICTPIPDWTRKADVLSWVLRYKLGLFWKKWHCKQRKKLGRKSRCERNCGKVR